MLPTNPTPAITVDELKESIAWSRLRMQQREFLIEYFAAGLAQGRYDIAAACHFAYPKVTNTKVWVNRLQSNPRIRAVLALYFGLGETEVVLADVKALIKKSKRKGARLDLLVPYWIRTAAALEAIAAKGTVVDVKEEN
jgi:hypothetical protein